MSDMSDFEREYFLQTRREIDTEKHERDQLLNFAILVLGAIVFGVAQSENAQRFLEEATAPAIEVPALAITSTLCWIRRKKLQQIADRWFVLHLMLVEHFGSERAETSLEGIAVQGLRGRRYVWKDVVLNWALSLPLYVLLATQVPVGWRLHE